MRGFTLIEVFIILAILVVVFLASSPLYNYFLSFSIHDSVRQEIMQNIKLAQSKAQSGEGGSDFGVKFETSQYTLYEGPSFTGRQPTQDMVFSLPAHFEVLDSPEVNFASKSGLPKAGAVINIISILDGRSETITVDANGLVR